MADIHNITGDLGDERSDFTAASGGTTSTGLTLTVDSDKITTKGEMVNALKLLIDYTVENDYPPA